MARGERTDPTDQPRPTLLEGLVFGGPGVDRDADRRSDDALLPGLLVDPSTAVLDCRGGRFRVVDGSLGFRPPQADDVGRLGVYLGRTRAVAGGTNTAYVGIVDPSGPTDVGDWHGVRSMAAGLGTVDASLVATLSALANWHGVHGFCSRCGAETVPTQSGWSRRCPADGSEHFPRTDPAVIMAVVDDDDRILLARGSGFTTTGMSVLAGFLEPGETLTAAVTREVAEEVGVEVDRVEYLGDQPWPFPSGLMVGFRAHARTTDLRPQPGEIEAARWFDRETLLRDIEAERVHIPQRLSIARALIEHWFGGPLAAPDLPLRR